MIEENLSQVSDAVKLLIQQFRGKPHVEALLSSYIKQVQELETAIFLVHTQRQFALAEGTQLDGIGQIVGLQRNGADDSFYRVLLMLKVLVNRSKANVDDIILMVHTLSGDVADFEVREFATGVAEFELEIFDILDADQAEIQWVHKFLSLMRGAGIRCLTFYPNDAALTDTHIFSFGPSNDHDGTAYGFPDTGVAGSGGGFIRGDET